VKAVGGHAGALGDEPVDNLCQGHSPIEEKGYNEDAANFVVMQGKDTTHSGIISILYFV